MVDANQSLSTAEALTRGGLRGSRHLLVGGADTGRRSGRIRRAGRQTGPTRSYRGESLHSRGFRAFSEAGRRGHRAGRSSQGRRPYGASPDRTDGGRLSQALRLPRRRAFSAQRHGLSAQRALSGDRHDPVRLTPQAGGRLRPTSRRSELLLGVEIIPGLTRDYGDRVFLWIGESRGFSDVGCIS